MSFLPSVRLTACRIITHSEEIAFYGGHEREKAIIMSKFSAIVKHMNNMFVKYFYMGIFDGFLVKYGAVMLGYAVLGLPVFGPGSEEVAILFNRTLFCHFM
jgi:ATP-binding cassette subfamily D (ALD) protein 3